MKFYPYEKGGGKGISHAEGCTTSFEVVFTQLLEVSAILKRGCQKVPLAERKTKNGHWDSPLHRRYPNGPPGPEWKTSW